MNQTNPFPPAKPGLMHRSSWRLIRWRLLRRVRRWEVRPVGQRKRQVLTLFAGLLLLGGWSVSSNLSGKPPELIHPQHVRQPTNPAVHR